EVADTDGHHCSSTSTNFWRDSWATSASVASSPPWSRYSSQRESHASADNFSAQPMSELQPVEQLLEALGGLLVPRSEGVVIRVVVTPGAGVVLARLLVLRGPA